jgi:hypothetical protein
MVKYGSGTLRTNEQMERKMSVVSYLEENLVLLYPPTRHKRACTACREFLCSQISSHVPPSISVGRAIGYGLQ